MIERLGQLSDLKYRIELAAFRARTFSGRASAFHEAQRKELVAEYNTLKYWFMRKMK